MEKKTYLTVKRILDIILSIVGIIVLSPLLLIVSILIKITSKGPVIFKQQRIGKDGKVFNIYKFRSMVVGAEKMGTGVYSKKGDSRVTKVGKFIRMTSIDELPQLLNILKGEMSFIGPRPVLTYHPWKYEEYTEEQLKRFEVRPGVTGWAQIHGRKQVEWVKRIGLDNYYVQNISFMLDLKILFKTISVVFTAKGNVNTVETNLNKCNNAKDKETCQKKDIVIISNYIHFKNEKGNSRFIYLADKLDMENIEIITTTFYHKTKTQRNISELPDEKFKTTLIYEPGYKKNISLKRLYSNMIIAKNIIKYLQKRERPDVIYCAVPPTTIGKKVAKFAKKNKIKFIIDIQDLWPEAYKMALNIPIISNILFYPIKRQADYTYKNADSIIAVSDTYLERAMKVNKTSTDNICVFLGTDLNEFDKYRQKTTEKREEIKLAYVGTLGNSYNIKLVIDAIKKLNNIKIKFIVMGDGPLRKEFEEYATKQEINYEFTGSLPYGKMVQKLCDCDIAVNPIKNGSAGSIINKVGDYAAAGLPVINTQNSNEYMNLVTKYNIGYNCENEDVEDISKKIHTLIENSELREEMGQNNRKLAEEKFNRNKTYQEIINLIRKE